jgi:hypothetical protein
MGHFMITLKQISVAVLALVAGLGATASASAADVTFMMRNNHPNAVEVELYSQDRDHVWPGNGEIYSLDDGETKQMPLSCEEGERICYGAWVAGDRDTYWGVGPGNTQACDDCCYTCTGGNTETIDLVE